MCGKSLVEETAMNSTTDGKDTLPTTTLENGFEATVVAGAVNPHLNLRKAMSCIIARSYYVKAYTGLEGADRDAYVAEHELNDLAILTALVVDDLGGFFGMIAYAGADSLDAAEQFVSDVAERVNAAIGTSDEAHQEYAQVLDARYTQHWGPIVEQDKLQDALAKLAK